MMELTYLTSVHAVACTVDPRQTLSLSISGIWICFGPVLG